MILLLLFLMYVPKPPYQVAHHRAVHHPVPQAVQVPHQAAVFPAPVHHHPHRRHLHLRRRHPQVHHQAHHRPVRRPVHQVQVRHRPAHRPARQVQVPVFRAHHHRAQVPARHRPAHRPVRHPVHRRPVRAQVHLLHRVHPVVHHPPVPAHRVRAVHPHPGWLRRICR